MRVLIARVAGGMSSLKENEATDRELDERTERSSEEKLAALIGMH